MYYDYTRGTDNIRQWHVAQHFKAHNGERVKVLATCPSERAALALVTALNHIAQEQGVFEINYVADGFPIGWCPFCGAVLRACCGNWSGNLRYIECFGCGARTPKAETMNNAMEYWR